tara:strand:+ start:418 stop:546 length:129 start_codon:yes stop_codon:yes gene_type:complete
VEAVLLKLQQAQKAQKALLLQKMLLPRPLKVAMEQRRSSQHS